jgi:hypothetical protein
MQVSKDDLLALDEIGKMKAWAVYTHITYLQEKFNEQQRNKLPSSN